MLFIVFSVAIVSCLDWGVPSQAKKDFLIVTSNVDLTTVEQTQTVIENQDKSMPSEGLRDQILEEFKSYDIDENGILSLHELKQSFHGEAQQQVREMFGFGDSDMNGHLTFPEFFRFRTSDL